MESKVVELREELFYGNGRHKKCYIHPENENLCIKVPYNDGGKIDLEREVKFVRLLKKIKKTVLFCLNTSVKFKHLEEMNMYLS